MTCQITEGILEAGISGAISGVQVTAGIASGAQVSLTTAGITGQLAGLPGLPLAAHIGNGSILFAWLPAVGQIDYYEINFSTNLTGVYQAYGRSIFKENNSGLGLISNFPFGRDLYFRIRAATEDGSFSDWVQVKLGILQKQTTQMRVRGPEGSIVVSGARVAMLDGVDRLAGFFAEENVVLQ